MKHRLELPYFYGEVVQERLKVLERDKKYEGYTLNASLEVIKRTCSIENDGNWNYHNNYDNSEDVLLVGSKEKWWTLNETEIKNIQRQHVERAIKELSEEVERLRSLI